MNWYRTVKLATPTMKMTTYPENVQYQAVRQYLNGDSIESIAKGIGVNPGSVLSFLKSKGVYQKRDTRLYLAKQPEHIQNYIIKSYQDGKSAAEIGEHIGFGETAVRRFLEYKGIELRETIRSPALHRILALPESEQEEIIFRFQNGINNAQLAKEYGVPESSMLSFLNEKNVPIPPGRTPRSMIGRLPEDKQQEVIQRYNSGEGVRSIARDYGISHVNLWRFINRQRSKPDTVQDNINAPVGSMA